MLPWPQSLVALISPPIKAASRRLKAAFGKLQIVTLIELGVHNPLAAAVAGSDTGEITLAQKIWKHVPEGFLLLVDRGFGSTLTLDTAQRAWGNKQVDWLARIRKDIKSEVIERLASCVRHGMKLVEGREDARRSVVVLIVA